MRQKQGEFGQKQDEGEGESGTEGRRGMQGDGGRRRAGSRATTSRVCACACVRVGALSLRGVPRPSLRWGACGLAAAVVAALKTSAGVGRGPGGGGGRRGGSSPAPVPKGVGGCG